MKKFLIILALGMGAAIAAGAVVTETNVASINHMLVQEEEQRSAQEKKWRDEARASIAATCKQMTIKIPACEGYR